MLSNMHTNANAAHNNFSNPHPFSLNISPSSTGAFVNQNPEQAPASNHPVANAAASAAGQNYNVQKGVNLSTPQQGIEKSQANGTTDCEPVAQSGYTPSVPVPPSPQKHIEVDASSSQKNESETLTAETKIDNIQKVTLEVSTSAKLEEVTQETDGPVQPENLPSPKKEEPVKLEKEISLSPDKANIVSETKAETLKAPEEPKVEKDLSKKDEKVKVAPIKDQRQETQEKMPVKAAVRKTKMEKLGTPSSSSAVGSAKRQRIRTQHYQSPLPEVELVSKISTNIVKNNDEKLIVFYKNEFLAVRNAEGSFYLCQAVQNIYKSSPKIRIRWLSQESQDKKGEVYTPDFYDSIDFDCILTNLSLQKADKGKFILPLSEKSRTESILNRSLAVEKGEEISSPSLTEEHPDGLDLSLYRGDDEQRKKRKTKKRSRKTSPSDAPKETPTKKSPKTAKVRKVEPPAKKPLPKKVATKKVAAKKTPIKKAVEPKPVASVAPKSNKTSGKALSKPSSSKTSPVVDQKKAKVLARIGRKAAVVTVPAKNNTKNEKSGIKAVASTSKATVQAKTSSNGSVKRTIRKSARK